MRSPFSIRLFTSTAIGLLAAVPAMAQDAKTPDYNAVIMDRVTVIGSAEAAQKLPGSGTYLDLENTPQASFQATDVNRVLRKIPGVNLQEEEGYGNRPNIGLRGGRSERSADITLMEDGILIAPAPYASPSAYYFPRISRMEAVEVRKGSSTVQYGPRTTSGAINLISSSIPEEEELEAVLGAGTDNAQRAQFHYGNSVENFGYVFDFGHERANGFKSQDAVGGNTGYEIQDIMGKFRVNTDATVDIYQSLEFKIGYTNEDSDETYLGLTEADFDDRPFRRYAAAQEDNMDAEHSNYSLQHFIAFDAFDVTTTAYYNRFSRNWYKWQNATVGGTSLSGNSALNSAAHLAALRGETDLDGSAANNITLRANNRDYYSLGIQSKANTELDLGNTNHKLEVGVRQHYDEEDRFQREDQYSITSGVMNRTTRGAPGSNANRQSSAHATAVHLLDEISYGPWTFSPGLRYEHIELQREQPGSATRENTVDAFVPGAGLSYAVNNDWLVFGGIHKGFAPPSPGSTNDEEEESINYEAGVRYNNGIMNAELVGFYNYYSNLLGECTLSSGCTNGAVGDQFNAGEVDVQGIEFAVGYDAATAFNAPDGMMIPLNFNYTFTDAEFNNSFTSSFDEWGTVNAGDELPYIPEHQFFVSAGVVMPKWQVNVAGKFVDEMRTTAGSGDIPDGEGTDAHFVMDLAAEYEVVENTRAFFTAENIFDEEYVAARRPAGARPGKPATFLIGAKYAF